MEQWKDVKGYEGLYQISNEGRVKSLNYKRMGIEKVMRPQKDKNGYLIIHFCKNGIHYNHKIHRLVAEAFIVNPNNSTEVNHINENKDDNRAENLEWCNRKYNMNYGTIIQRKRDKLTKPILQLTTDGILIKEWNGAKEIQRETSYFQSNISRCCNGLQKTAYGYKWKYVA